MENEVVGKAILIAGNGLVEVLGLNAVKAGQVGIEHDALPANQVDLRGYALDGDDAPGLRLGHVPLCPPAQAVSSLLVAESFACKRPVSLAANDRARSPGASARLCVLLVQKVIDLNDLENLPTGPFLAALNGLNEEACFRAAAGHRGFWLRWNDPPPRVTRPHLLRGIRSAVSSAGPGAPAALGCARRGFRSLHRAGPPCGPALGSSPACGACGRRSA